MTIAVKLLAVLVLVAANGFFVAAEFALVGVRSSRIETLAASGDRAAKRLMGLLQNLNAYLSACQLGITLASLALGWIGEPAIARLLEGPLAGFSETARHAVAFAVAFSIITSLHIVLGGLPGADRAVSEHQRRLDPGQHEIPELGRLAVEGPDMPAHA